MLDEISMLMSAAGIVVAVLVVVVLVLVLGE